MIELRGVTKRYAGRAVVDDLTLTVPDGGITALIGPSGCGKTTTLEMMNGLVQPDAGTIRVGDAVVGESDLIALRRRMGYVIQEGGLFPHYTVFENVATVPRLLGWPEARVADRVREMMALVNLPETRLDAVPAALSGGQRQRVGVARALAANPDYLLMDEPFSALDPVNRGRLREEFRRIQARLGKTVVLVTHDLDEALFLADTLAVMGEGRLHQVDDPLTILRNPADAFVRGFLGDDPALRALLLGTISDLAASKKRALPVVRTNQSSDAVARILRENGAEMAFVTIPEGVFAGLVRATDLDGHAGQLPVLRDVPTLSPSDSLRTALSRFLESGLDCLPVIDDNGLAGQVHWTDIQSHYR